MDRVVAEGQAPRLFNTILISCFAAAAFVAFCGSARAEYAGPSQADIDHASVVHAVNTARIEAAVNGVRFLARDDEFHAYVARLDASNQIRRAWPAAR